MTADAQSVYRRLIACARFEITASRQLDESGQATSTKAQRQARIAEARLRNAEEMAQAAYDFDIMMRAGKPLPSEWRRRES